MIKTTAQYVKMSDALIKWNEAYRKGKPIVDDSVYDQIRRTVQEYEEYMPEYVVADSPVNAVGLSVIPENQLSGGDVVKHTTRMLSLENALNSEEAAKWIKKWRKQFGDDVRIIGEFKYNGLAINSVYVDGVLTKASTRGDGDYGQDVTRKLNIVLPYTIDAEGVVEITGELVIPIRKYNDKYSSIYANPLSAVVGILASDSILEINDLQFIPYNITSTDTVLKSHSGALELIRDVMKGYGFWPNIQYLQIGLDEIESSFRLVESIRNTIPIDLDGMVFKIDDYAQRALTKDTNHHPNHSFAYKFTPSIETTTLNSVVFQVGRTGVITGVAKLSPVTLLGCRVTSAVIENEAKMQELEIAIGDMYGVYKSGDVIPKLTKRILGDNPLVKFPTECPCCKEPLLKVGAELYCTNDICDERIVAEMSYLASKEVLNIHGLGPSTIRSIVTKLNIISIIGVFGLTTDELATLPGYSKHSARSLKQHIDTARYVSLPVFITALCIPGIGKATASRLADIVGNADEFMGLTSLDAIDAKGLDIEPAIAIGIVNYLTKVGKFEDAVSLRNTLVVAGKEITDRPIVVLGGVTGHSFAFTGYIGMDRKLATDKIKHFGGTVTDSVTSVTDYLVAAGEKNPSNSNKYKRASLLGVRVLSPNEFAELLDPANDPDKTK